MNAAAVDFVSEYGLFSLGCLLCMTEWECVRIRLGNAGGCVTAAGFEFTGRLIQGLAGCSDGTGRKSDFHIGVAHRIWHDACV